MGHLSATDLDWSAPDRSELAELGGLLTAIEHLDEPTERHSLSGLEEAFDEHGSEPERNIRLGRDSGGTLVAYGWVHPIHGDRSPRRVFLTGGVHPGWRGRRIGSAVLSWQLDRARQWYAETFVDGYGPLQSAIYADEKLTTQARLYARHGFKTLRWFADMTVQFSTLRNGPTDPELPAGCRLVPFSDELSDQVRQAHNEAFADHWGAQPVDELRWREQLSYASARPDWSWVVLAGDPDGSGGSGGSDGSGGSGGSGDVSEVVAGYALNAAYEQDWTPQGYREGWTDRLGVRRQWRGQGLATALLAASMRSFAGAGLDAAGLGVDSDNPSGAFALYAKLGYTTGETAVMYGRTEAPEIRSLSPSPFVP